MADVVELLSNQVGVTLTPEGIRRLAAYDDGMVHIEEPQAFKIHGLEARLGPETVRNVVTRYESGESATSIAKDLSVAPSALLRLLARKGVVVRKHGLTPEQDSTLASEYEAGATMAELEKKHQLSHGAVIRALRRAGVTTRPVGTSAKHLDSCCPETPPKFTQTSFTIRLTPPAQASLQVRGPRAAT